MLFTNLYENYTIASSTHFVTTVEFSKPYNNSVIRYWAKKFLSVL